MTSSGARPRRSKPRRRGPGLPERVEAYVDSPLMTRRVRFRRQGFEDGEREDPDGPEGWS